MDEEGGKMPHLPLGEAAVAVAVVVVDNRHPVGDKNFPGGNIVFHVMGSELEAQGKFPGRCLLSPVTDSELLAMSFELLIQDLESEVIEFDGDDEIWDIR